MSESVYVLVNIEFHLLQSHLKTGDLLLVQCHCLVSERIPVYREVDSYLLTTGNWIF